MAGSVNKVILIGNLGADPEVRHTQDGRIICNMRLATTDIWRDKQSGDRREKVEWHSCVIFTEGLAKLAQQYLKKGSKIYLEGSLQTRKWQDNSGNDRYSTEVVIQAPGHTITMLDGRQLGEERQTQIKTQPKRQEGSRVSPSSFEKDLDDEIPFAPEFR